MRALVSSSPAARWLTSSMIVCALGPLAGCDPATNFASDDGRLRFRTPGQAPATLPGNDLGSDPHFLVGSAVGFEIARYCPDGWGGSCQQIASEAARDELCMATAIPPGLEGEEAGELVMPEGVVVVETLPTSCAEPGIEGDRTTLHGVRPEEVSLALVERADDDWVGFMDLATDTEGSVFTEGAAAVEAPQPLPTGEPWRVVAGARPQIYPLLRDPAGIPVAFRDGTSRWQVLAGDPEFGRDGDGALVTEGGVPAPAVRVGEGDRLSLSFTLEGAAMAPVEVLGVAPDLVAEVTLGLVYLPVGDGTDPDEPDAYLLARAWVSDAGGSRFGDAPVRFEASGEGVALEAAAEEGDGASLGFEVRNTGDEVDLARCVQVRASVGAQMDEREVCFELPRKPDGCTCRAGERGAPRAWLGPLLLALVARRRRRAS